VSDAGVSKLLGVVTAPADEAVPAGSGRVGEAGMSWAQNHLDLQ